MALEILNAFLAPDEVLKVIPKIEENGWVKLTIFVRTNGDTVEHFEESVPSGGHITLKDGSDGD